jgi:glutamate/tyrosine decarboxylase-like PLP-dependent enzyme
MSSTIIIIRAAMVTLGEEGYKECARAIMAAAKKIDAGVRTIPGLRVLGKPDMSVIAFAADETHPRGKNLNIYAVHMTPLLSLLQLVD